MERKKIIFRYNFVRNICVKTMLNKTHTTLKKSITSR